MNHNLTVLLTLLCIAPGALAAGQPDPSPSEYPPIYITHVTVVDTATGKEARDQTVVITSDRISKVGGSKSIKARRQAGAAQRSVRRPQLPFAERLAIAFWTG
jgi:hypothetical protein